MAVYTDVTDAELEALLEGFDLGRPHTFKGIAEGTENSNFLLETGRGRFILTVYERRVKEADLPFFLGLMHWLQSRGFPSASPIPDRQGRTLQLVRGKPAALIAFMPGISVRRPDAAHCRAAGDGLAWLHLAAEGFRSHRVNDLGHPSWRPMFQRLESAAERLKTGLGATIAADLALLDEAWPADLPGGVIHADYFPDNVLFLDGRFSAAIDFYFSADDLLAYDIGVALNAWCFESDGAFNVTLARAFVGGYQTRRPLSEGERSALPILAWGAAMQFFLTRLADWGATPEGALVRPKDPLEYERKLAAHRASHAAGLGLLGSGG